MPLAWWRTPFAVVVALLLSKLYVMHFHCTKHHTHTHIHTQTQGRIHISSLKAKKTINQSEYLVKFHQSNFISIHQILTVQITYILPSIAHVQPTIVHHTHLFTSKYLCNNVQYCNKWMHFQRKCANIFTNWNWNSWKTPKLEYVQIQRRILVESVVRFTVMLTCTR